MPAGAITEPPVIAAILAIAGAAATLFVLICPDMAAADRRKGREK